MKNFYDNVNYQHIKRAVLRLNNDQILGFHTANSYEIVAAPGPKKAIIPYTAIIQTKLIAPYTNFDANGRLSISVVDDTGFTGLVVIKEQDVIFDQIFGLSSQIGTVPASVYCSTNEGQPNMGWDPATLDNAPLLFVMNNGVSGDLEGGDPDNLLQLTVFYSVVNLI